MFRMSVQELSALTSSSECSFGPTFFSILVCGHRPGVVYRGHHHRHGTDRPRAAATDGGGALRSARYPDCAAGKIDSVCYDHLYAAKKSEIATAKYVLPSAFMCSATAGLPVGKKYSVLVLFRSSVGSVMSPSIRTPT